MRDLKREIENSRMFRTYSACGTDGDKVIPKRVRKGGKLLKIHIITLNRKELLYLF